MDNIDIDQKGKILDIMIAAIQDDVERLEKACGTLVENSRGKDRSIESNGTKEAQIDELQQKIKMLELRVEDDLFTIDTLVNENKNLRSEIALLKESKSNGITQNGKLHDEAPSLKIPNYGSLRDVQREHMALVETNEMLEMKIRGLMEELQKNQDKEKGVLDSILQQKEKKDFLAKLDEFDFLFRKEATAYRPYDLQPSDKLNKILEAVKDTMSHYFHFVVLAIKYDAIQAGNSKFCSMDATDLYEQALATHPYHGDWPLFVLSRLHNRPSPAPSRRSLIIPGTNSGYFSPQVAKRVTFSPDVTSHRSAKF